MSIALINGVKLYWELNGQMGDPLVLVHGSWGDHYGWDQIVSALSRSFRVLTYDRRGHSQSERPTFLDEHRDPESLMLNLQRLANFAQPALLTQGDQIAPFFPRVLDEVAPASPCPAADACWRRLCTPGKPSTGIH